MRCMHNDFANDGSGQLSVVLVKLAVLLPKCPPSPKSSKKVAHNGQGRLMNYRKTMQITSRSSNILSFFMWQKQDKLEIKVPLAI